MPYMTKRKTTSDGIVPIGSNLFGTCSSGAASVNKTVSLPDFDVLVAGVTIHVYFASENTASNPTLTVGSTAGKPIRRNGTASGKWASGSVVSFTYDGSNWIQNDSDDSGKTYTMTLSGHTITLTDSDGGTQSVTVPDDDTQYGLAISGNTVSLVVGGSDDSIDLPAYFGLVRIVSGGAGQSFVADASNDGIGFIAGDNISLSRQAGVSPVAGNVRIDADNTTYTISVSGDQLTMTDSDGNTQTVTVGITLKYTKDVADTATSTNNVVQNYVNGNIASGGYALAEGLVTTATGSASHAEGVNTEASGAYSHAENGNTVAYGDYSHASGMGTIAKGKSQTVIGEYNIEDNDTPVPANPSFRTKFAYIVGNGTSTSNKSDAYRLSWKGSPYLFLDVDASASSSTDATSGDDMDLFNAIRALGWYADAIV